MAIAIVAGWLWACVAGGVGAACPQAPHFATLDEGTGLLNFTCGRSWEVDLVADADCGVRCHPRYTHGPLAEEVRLFRKPTVVRREYVHAFCDVWPIGRVEQVLIRPVERAAARARLAAGAGVGTGAPDIILMLFEGVTAERLDAVLPRTLAQLRSLGGLAGGGTGGDSGAGDGANAAAALRHISLAVQAVPSAAAGENGSGALGSGLGEARPAHSEDEAVRGWRALLGSLDGEGSALCALRAAGYVTALAADRCGSDGLDAIGATVAASAALAAAPALLPSEPLAPAHARAGPSSAGAGDDGLAAVGVCLDHLLLEPFCTAQQQLARLARAPRCVGAERAHRVALRYLEALLAVSNAAPRRRRLYAAAEAGSTPPPRFVAAALDLSGEAGGPEAAAEMAGAEERQGLDADLAAWLGGLVRQREELGEPLPAVLLLADGGSGAQTAGGAGAGGGAFRGREQPRRGSVHLLLPRALLRGERADGAHLRANAEASRAEPAGGAAGGGAGGEAGGAVGLLEVRRTLLDLAGVRPESGAAAASLLGPLPPDRVQAMPRATRAGAGEGAGAARPAETAQEAEAAAASSAAIAAAVAAAAVQDVAPFSCPAPRARAPAPRCMHPPAAPPNASLLASLRANSDEPACSFVPSFARLRHGHGAREGGEAGDDAGWLELSGCGFGAGGSSQDSGIGQVSGSGGVCGYSLGFDPRMLAFGPALEPAAGEAAEGRAGGAEAIAELDPARAGTGAPWRQLARAGGGGGGAAAERAPSGARLPAGTEVVFAYRASRAALAAAASEGPAGSPSGAGPSPAGSFCAAADAPVRQSNGAALRLRCLMERGLAPALNVRVRVARRPHLEAMLRVLRGRAERAAGQRPPSSSGAPSGDAAARARASAARPAPPAPPAHLPPLSMAVILVDSISAARFRALMPRTAAFLDARAPGAGAAAGTDAGTRAAGTAGAGTRAAGSGGAWASFRFDGYAAVGSNSPRNQLPLLSGLASREYAADFRGAASPCLDPRYDDGARPPAANRSCSRWIFDRFAERGYATAFATNMCDWGVMEEAHALRTRRPPTHHSLISPWCLPEYDADKLYFRPLSRCLGDGRAHAPLLAYGGAFHARYAAAGLPALSWSVLLEGHEPTGAGAASLDADLAAHLAGLEAAHGGHLGIALLSDHGIHYGPLFDDANPAGRREHLAPPLFLALPRRWLRAHPRAAANLCANRRRLVTPFDVHATLSHVLNLPDAAQFPRWAHRRFGPGETPISLFEPVPALRTCAQAWVPPAHCPCGAGGGEAGGRAGDDHWAWQ